MSLVGGAFFTKSFGHNCILTSKKILSNFCQKNFGTIWNLRHETQTVERPKKWNNPLWVDFDFFMTHLMRVFCLKILSLPPAERRTVEKLVLIDLRMRNEPRVATNEKNAAIDNDSWSTDIRWKDIWSLSVGCECLIEVIDWEQFWTVLWEPYHWPHRLNFLSYPAG